MLNTFIISHNIYKTLGKLLFLISILQIRKIEHWKITLVNQIYILQYGRTSELKWNKILWIQMSFTYKYAQLNCMHMLTSEHFCILYLSEFSYKNYFFPWKHIEDSASKNIYLLYPFSVTTMIDCFVVFSFNLERSGGQKWSCDA